MPAQVEHERRHLFDQRLDAFAAVVDFGRCGVQADGDACAGSVDQTDRFVGQLPAGNVAVRQPHRGLDRLVQHLHPMMPLERGRHAPNHQDAFLFARLGHLDDLDTYVERSLTPRATALGLDREQAQHLGSVYGSLAPSVLALAEGDPRLAERLCPTQPSIAAEIARRV